MKKNIKSLPPKMREQVAVIANYTYSGDQEAALKEIIKLGINAHATVLVPTANTNSPKPTTVSHQAISPPTEVNQSKKDDTAFIKNIMPFVEQAVKSFGGKSLKETILSNKIGNHLNALINVLLNNIELEAGETGKTIIITNNPAQNKSYLAFATTKRYVVKPFNETSNKNNTEQTDAICRIVPIKEAFEKAIENMDLPEHLEDANRIEIDSVIDDFLMPMLLDSFLN